MNDSLICETVKFSDTVYVAVSDSLLWVKAQGFYKSSFDNLLVATSIAIGIITLLFIIISLFNSWQARSIRKEMKQELKEACERISSLEEKMKAEVKEQGSYFYKLIEEKLKR